jgi:hypothetical protein
MNTSHANPTIDVPLASDEPGTPGSDAADNAARTIDAARERATEALESTRAWIVANPAAAIGLAVGTGFLVGRVARR